MKYLQIKDIVINKGMPKICVPVMKSGEKEILSDFHELSNLEVDLIELRADYYEFVQNHWNVINLLEKIRELYKGPLLFTLRTKYEGGFSDIKSSYYFKLNNMVIESRLVDLIDIEFYSDYEEFNKVNFTINLAKKNKIATILSNHEFLKTPSEDEIMARVKKMLKYGDIAKIAVMPNSEKDVLALLSASLQLKQEKKGPFIAIAMGPLGTVSRISCELFGSCMTYASYKGQSAPGQLSLSCTKEILKIMHIN